MEKDVLIRAVRHTSTCMITTVEWEIELYNEGGVDMDYIVETKYRDQMGNDITEMVMPMVAEGICECGEVTKEEIAGACIEAKRIFEKAKKGE